jgi:hypothetical protein
VSNPFVTMPPSGTPVTVGPPISANPGLFLRYAGEAIGGHKIVYCDADDLLRIVDPLDNAQAALALGVTIQSALEGELQYVRFSGELRDQSFDFEPGLIFVGSNGSLTQIVPTDGNLIVVGHSVGRDCMRVTMSQIATLETGA